MSLTILGLLGRKTSCLIDQEFDHWNHWLQKLILIAPHFVAGTMSSKFILIASNSIHPWRQNIVSIARNSRNSIINHLWQKFILLAKHLDHWRQKFLRVSFRIAYNQSAPWRQSFIFLILFFARFANISILGGKSSVRSPTIRYGGNSVFFEAAV